MGIRNNCANPKKLTLEFEDGRVEQIEYPEATAIVAKKGENVISFIFGTTADIIALSRVLVVKLYGISKGK